jgi:hypothetical protein
MERRLQTNNKPLSCTEQTARHGSASLQPQKRADHTTDQRQSFLRVAEMPRITCRTWTAEQIKLLCALVDRGVSPARASVVLKRRRLAVQNKARELGRPFAGSRQVRAMRLTKEADARKAFEQSAQKLRPDPEGASQHANYASN